MIVPAATFGWLCVETHNLMGSFGGMKQPPSGGCVLKPTMANASVDADLQPPSGGCVLKRLFEKQPDKTLKAAAFGRLCVETVSIMVKCLMRYSSSIRTILRCNKT